MFNLIIKIDKHNLHIQLVINNKLQILKILQLKQLISCEGKMLNHKLWLLGRLSWIKNASKTCFLCYSQTFVNYSWCLPCRGRGWAPSCRHFRSCSAERIRGPCTWVCLWSWPSKSEKVNFGLNKLEIYQDH